MATLNSGFSTLEISFPYARSDAVIYAFRFLWDGHDVVSKAARFREEQTEASESTPYHCWAYQRDYLCDTLSYGMSKNTPVYWWPMDPGISLCVMPGHSNLHSLFDFATEAGHFHHFTENKGRFTFPPEAKEENAFTVHVELQCSTYLAHKECCSGGDLVFSLSTNRGDLHAFTSELRREYKECQSGRKLPPSQEDVIWRALY